MSVLKGAALAVAAVALGVAPLSAQRVMSAQSGTIHHTEGRVDVNNERIKTKAYGPFTQLKEGQELTTQDGKAEILLNPGVFLRVAENSSVTMLSTQLADTKVRVNRGDVVLEVADLPKENSVSLLYQDLLLNASKKGIYRFDTEANLFRVYAGEAELKSAAMAKKIGKGHQLSLSGDLAESKFDRKESDAFLAWNENRDGQMSIASVSTARSLYRSGFSPTMGGWYYDPLFGMYGYVPYRSYFASPFGYYYFSPVASWNAYQPGWGGYGNGGVRSGSVGGGSGTMASQAPPVPNGHMGGGSAPSYSGGGGMSSGGFSSSAGAAHSAASAPSGGGSGGAAATGHRGR